MTIPSELARTLVVLLASLSAVALVLTAASGWRAARIRVGFDVIRIAVGLAALVAMSAIAGIQTPAALAAAVALAGFVLGIAQGRATRVEIHNGQPYGRRSPAGLAVWGLGLVGMQLAGLGSRVAVFRIGQAAGIFGVALMLGVFVGRSGPVKRARLAGPGAAAAAALVMVAMVAVSGHGARAQTGEGNPLDDPQTACAVMPDGLQTVPLDHEQAVGEVGACRGIGDGRLVQLVLYRDSEQARLAYDGEIFSEYTTLGTVDVGDSGKLAGELASGRLDSVDFVRGPFLVSVVVTAGGVTSEAGSLELARLTDAKIVAVLEAAATASDDGSTTEASPGDGAEPDADSTTGASAPQDGVEAESGSDDAASPGDPELATGIDPSGEGWLDRGSISSDEAVAAAAAAVLVALGMGVIGLAEASTRLTDIFRRANRPDRSGDLLAVMDRASTTSPAGSFDPMTLDERGEFEPLEHGTEAAFPSSEAEPSVDSSASEESPGVEAARPLDEAAFDERVMEGLEDVALGGQRPPESGLMPGPEGLQEVELFDTDADGEFDAAHIDRGGDGTVEEVLGFGDRSEAPPEAVAPLAEESATSEAEPAVEATEESPLSDEPAGIRVSEQEVADIVERGRQNGTPVSELQSYLDGMNAGRGGAGSVPIGNLQSVELPSGQSVTAFADEIAGYREALDDLAGTALLDGFLQDTYVEAATEKEKWVRHEMNIEWRAVASIQDLVQEVYEFDAKIADAELGIRALADTESFAERGPRNPLYDHHMKDYWEKGQHDLPKLQQQIAELKQARLERVNEMMGTNVSSDRETVEEARSLREQLNEQLGLAQEGETRPPTDLDRASVAHRPAIMLDKLEEHMDGIIAERKRVMEVRAQAQRVVDEFESRFAE